MDERSVVTVFLRTGGEVLLLRRSDEVGSYRGKWGALLGSTAEKVVRTAESPVVTVREKMND